MKIEKMLEKFAYDQSYKLGNDEEYDFISFYFEKTDTDVINPYLDEMGMNEVDSEKYYGKTNFEEWKKEAIARINEK